MGLQLDARADFRLTITTRNAAFHEDDRTDDGENNHEAEGAEVARILRAVAGFLADEGSRAGECRDANGNTVGSYTFTTED